MPSDRRRDGLGCSEVLSVKKLRASAHRSMTTLTCMNGAHDILRRISPSLFKEIGPTLEIVSDILTIKSLDATQRANAIQFTTVPRMSPMIPRRDIDLRLMNAFRLDVLTGWNQDDLLQWKEAVFGAGPGVIRGIHGHSFDLDITIVASLYRWRCAPDYKVIAIVCGRDGRQWGEGIDQFTNLLFQRYAKKLMKKNSVSRYKDVLVECRDAITHRLANPNNPTWDPFFCMGPEGTIIGFVDCMMLNSTRPGSTTIGGSTSFWSNLMQQAFYSGYAKGHGYK